MIIDEGMYLEHHGILGQKWGVRRFQNVDGSYKPAGKIRYSQASREATGSGHIKDQHRSNVQAINDMDISQERKDKMLAKEDKSYKQALKNQETTDKIKTAHEQKIKDIDAKYNNDLVKKYLQASENTKFEKAMKKQEEINNGKAKIKKALLIAGGVALTAAVAYGLYKSYTGNPLPADFDPAHSIDWAKTKEAEWAKSKDLVYSKSKFANKNSLGQMIDGLSRRDQAKYKNAVNFTNSVYADTYHKAANFSNKHWESLSLGDKNGIKTYTSQAYAAINDLLRTGKGENPTTRMWIDQCTSALEKSRIKEDCIVHRGIGNALPKVLGISPEELASDPTAIVGKTFTDKGFVSTGVGQYDAWGGVKMHIFVPAGSKGMYVDPVSTYKGEHELLLQRNSSFVVKGVTKDARGKVSDVLVEIIDQTI